MSFSIQVVICLSLNSNFAPWLIFLKTAKAERECLRSFLHWCLSLHLPLLPSTHPSICCTANSLFVLSLWWLFWCGVFCISDLCLYISPSFPSFSPAVLLSSCVIFLGTYGPWHCHTHKFLFYYDFLLPFVLLFSLTCHNWFVGWTWLNNFSHPRVSKRDMQSGLSPAVRADSSLALINWSHSRRKRMLWAFTISGSRLLCFLCLLTLVQSHTRMEEKKQT